MINLDNLELKHTPVKYAEIQKAKSNQNANSLNILCKVDAGFNKRCIINVCALVVSSSSYRTALILKSAINSSKVVTRFSYIKGETN